ncbi:uncharacterized protein F5891DRAFT_1017510 [Suillus fuscotomentosus]|uniref:Uncharacterized protein n=1 Tax=Suillus fuscotomentosus TaxID=1912939 RepID=A0AAD4EEV1_9AGAM|nr:uncharacterized protein F5891DRAFT_1017510 [Suillus fuscotomentosus]KAG1903633.1 hypothetical protein F5891DRAFT_1017510 [Suillus fuscotomentosus]
MWGNQARINALLRKSLIGELIDTQFHLFSVRSKREGNVTNLQALFANDEALTTGSEYFSSLLSENSFNDSAVVEFQDYHTCEGGISLDEYGYASDSDLDEEEEETDEDVQDNERCAGVSAERVSRTASIKDFTTKGAQRIIPSRRVLVMDTAFNTWRLIFAPLRSQTKSARHHSLGGAPPCSPKSMYRVACKHNVLQELSSSLTSRFPAILEMEIEILFQNIVTPTVTKDFPMLIQRIASAGLPHGADILTKLHERMLKQHYPTILSPEAALASENECNGSPLSGPFKFKREEPQNPVMVIGDKDERGQKSAPTRSRRIHI